MTLITETRHSFTHFYFWQKQATDKQKGKQSNSLANYIALPVGLVGKNIVLIDYVGVVCQTVIKFDYFLQIKNIWGFSRMLSVQDISKTHYFNYGAIMQKHTTYRQSEYKYLHLESVSWRAHSYCWNQGFILMSYCCFTGVAAYNSCSPSVSLNFHDAFCNPMCILYNFTVELSNLISIPCTNNHENSKQQIPISLLG